MSNMIEDRIMAISDKCEFIFKESELALDLILKFESKRGNSSSTTKRKHELASIMSSAKYKSAIIHENIDYVLEEIEYGSVENLILELNNAFNEVESIIETESLNMQDSIVDISNLERNMLLGEFPELYYDEYDKALSDSYDIERGLTSLYGESEALSDIINIIAESITDTNGQISHKTQEDLSQLSEFVNLEDNFKLVMDPEKQIKTESIPNITININISDNNPPLDPFSRF